MSKTRTITLTGRRPVVIHEDAWPVIAEASDDGSFHSHDPALRNQAISQGQLDQWWLKVRQHADGRTLVYGGYNAGQFVQSDRDADTPARAGLLLEVDADVAAAVEQVAATLGIPGSTAAECVADLPAEELL